MTTLRIDERTKKRLLQYKLEESVKAGKELSYSEVISILLDLANNKKKE